MSHPIIELQAMLVAALRAEDLPVFDTPPSGATPPYLAIVRHDVVSRDGDAAPATDSKIPPRKSIPPSSSAMQASAGKLGREALIFGESAFVAAAGCGASCALD